MAFLAIERNMVKQITIMKSSWKENFFVIAKDV